MKRINKKGFTLIELLAVIIILGVLLLIAVPSVSKYIQDSRMKTYKNNLSGFVSAVANEVNAMDYDSKYNFTSDQILIVPFETIELEKGSNTKSPFANYDQTKSFVLVTRKYVDGSPAGYNYYVQAVDMNGYGAELNTAENVEIKAVGTGLVTLPTEDAPAEVSELKLPSTVVLGNEEDTAIILRK